MKVREVMTQTGLTDRAIRLYIENELVRPECSESFNGRKSIEFSESDVEQLKNIALLRKANFTILGIKTLQAGGEEARIALENHITKLREDIENNTRVLEALEGFDNDEEVNVKTVCNKIGDYVAANKVPSEDMRKSAGEVARKVIFGIIGIGGMIVSLFLCILYVAYLKSEFMFMRFDLTELSLNFFGAIAYPLIICLPLIQLILSTIIVIVTFKRRKPKKNKSTKKVLLVVLLLVLIISVFFLPMSMGMISFVPPVYSETNDPFDYMHLDNDVRKFHSKSILEVFPAVVPQSASKGYYEFEETTKYYYRYSNFAETEYTIIAEWVLPDGDYESTVNKMSEKGGDTAFRTTKGNWKCIYFKNVEYGKNHGYDYLLFAYNDTTGMVRYIADYSLDAENGDEPPHYSLKWE